MKTVHVNKNISSNLHSYYDFLNEAKNQERLGNFKEAVMLYQTCIKIKRSAEFAYNRIMIIYRNQKEWNKERRFILDAIKVFEVFYQQKHPPNSAVSRLSKSILKLTGVTDQKGKLVFDQQPIKRWKDRLKTVNIRLSKK